ncbi:hypothetical protein [Agrobacterium genomosp. 13]|uniref:Secreted protein n=1 Tax=Agrobacterium genomosp. 13 str. CFBP 6927 TaxID=1183428 RepID=A0ABM9VDZ7_9HYPH|nr:hypothetical protein [Agrobacterium genomosp. 13]CUX24200.1 conserved exported hypothetical protein [Agrobacterium genomosp. 13 str. CFBP 6927]
MTKNARILLAVLSLSAAVAGSISTPAISGEHSYHKGNSWQVVLKTPDPFGDEAFCGFRSTAWSGKSVAIEYTLIGIDKIVPRLRVTKQNWSLPAGQTTNVSIGTEWAGNIQFVSKVVNGDELYGEIPEDFAEDGGGFKVTTILGTAISTNKPAPLAVTFQGNEPPWLVPVMSYTEAIALGTGFDTCISTLTGLGPSLFKAPQASSTSPFAQPSGEGAGTAAQAPANRSVMLQNPPPKSAAANAASTSPWTFEQREEDWGDTCFVEAKQGDVTVGFMGAPGKDFVAFVDNGNFHRSVSASWKIDDKAPHMSNGHLDNYFGWHSFYELSPEILDEGKNGRELTIADLDGKTITISLASAATPFSQFQMCFNKAAPKTEKASNHPAATQTPPNGKGCVLEVGGIKAIDGACYWGPYSSETGSFVMEANGYFAIIEIDDNVADGWWNDTPGSMHAHTRLGEMKRDGKCWKSKSVRVCTGTK